MPDYTKEHVEMTKKGFEENPIANTIALPGHVLAAGSAAVLDIMLLPGKLFKKLPTDLGTELRKR